MQESTRDATPSSDSSKRNTDTIKDILEKIDRLHLLTEPSTFVWDDNLIPYSGNHLPEHLDKTRFLKEQQGYLSDTSQSIKTVLKQPHLRVLEIGKTFHIGDELGQGTFGKVLKAKWPPSDRQNMNGSSEFFAIKRFLKISERAPRDIVDSFIIERENLKKSEIDKHDHIVSFHTSFTDQTYFGFIMSPVAESTLKDLLEKSRESNVVLGDERVSLFEAFGCLLHVIRHLHVKLHMRHCDLKPSNILVCRFSGERFRVRLCDLGIAYAWNSSRDESTNTNQRGTAKYKAPEVHHHPMNGEVTSHNRSVDIFSTGCIFLEMYTILRSKTLDQMTRAITANHVTRFDDKWTYADSLEGAKKWLGELSKDSDGKQEEVIVDVIESMVSL